MHTMNAKLKERWTGIGLSTLSSLTVGALLLFGAFKLDLVKAAKQDDKDRLTIYEQQLGQKADKEELKKKADKEELEKLKSDVEIRFEREALAYERFLSTLKEQFKEQTAALKELFNVKINNLENRVENLEESKK